MVTLYVIRYIDFNLSVETTFCDIDFAVLLSLLDLTDLRANKNPGELLMHSLSQLSVFVVLRCISVNFL